MDKFRNFAPLRVFTKSCGGFEASSIDDLRSTASSYVGGTDGTCACGKTKWHACEQCAECSFMYMSAATFIFPFESLFGLCKENKAP